MGKILKNIAKGNFLGWHKSDEVANTINRIVDLNDLTKSLPILITNEEYSFYLNFDKDYELGINTNKKLVLLSCELTEIEDIDNCIIDLIGSYQLFVTFLKSTVHRGAYRLGLKDTVSNQLLIYSDILLLDDSLVNNSNYFIYKGAYDTELMKWSLIGDKYIKVRVLLTKGEIDYDQDIKQYRDVTTKSLRNITFYSDKFVQLKMYNVSEDFMDSIVELIQCYTFLVSGYKGTVKGAMKTTKQNNNLYTVTFDLYLPQRVDQSEDDVIIIYCRLQHTLIYEQIIN